MRLLLFWHVAGNIGVMPVTLAGQPATYFPKLLCDHAQQMALDMGGHMKKGNPADMSKVLFDPAKASFPEFAKAWAEHAAQPDGVYERPRGL